MIHPTLVVGKAFKINIHESQKAAMSCGERILRSGFLVASASYSNAREAL